MLNRESAIAAWRQQLIAGGIKSVEVLDELEAHLREDIDQQMQSGSTEQQAFQIAVARVGQPDALKLEFAKVGGAAQEQLKRAVFTLAGIPNATLATTMNTSHASIEPGWATYLKGAVFLVPALSLWAISLIFFFPKLQQICRDAGVAIPGIYRFTNHIADHNVFIGGGIILVLALLEWRSSKWPRYRRATVGIGVFLLNSAVLILITAMVFLAVLAAPALAHRGQ